MKLLVATLLAATLEATFADANRAYLRGDFAAAVQAYQRLVDLGVRDADLYYNLGNAYFRADRLGPAIWSYERALRLRPGDEDARFNLATARGRAGARVQDRLAGADRPPLWERAVASASSATWSLALLATYLASFLGFALLRRLTGPARAGVAVVAASAAAAALAFGLLLAGRVHLDERVALGIVLPDEVAVREGPDRLSRAAFQVHAGLAVRVRQREGEWLQIRLANGLQGWIHAHEIGRL